MIITAPANDQKSGLTLRTAKSKTVMNMRVAYMYGATRLASAFTIANKNNNWPKAINIPTAAKAIHCITSGVLPIKNRGTDAMTALIELLITRIWSAFSFPDSSLIITISRPSAAAPPMHISAIGFICQPTGRNKITAPMKAQDAPNALYFPTCSPSNSEAKNMAKIGFINERAIASDAGI